MSDIKNVLPIKDVLREYADLRTGYVYESSLIEKAADQIEKLETRITELESYIKILLLLD